MLAIEWRFWLIVCTKTNCMNRFTINVTVSTIHLVINTEGCLSCTTAQWKVSTSECRVIKSIFRRVVITHNTSNHSQQQWICHVDPELLLRCCFSPLTASLPSSFQTAPLPPPFMCSAHLEGYELHYFKHVFHATLNPPPSPPPLSSHAISLFSFVQPILRSA